MCGSCCQTERQNLVGCDILSPDYAHALIIIYIEFSPVRKNYISKCNNTDIDRFPNVEMKLYATFDMVWRSLWLMAIDCLVGVGNLNYFVTEIE